MGIVESKVSKVIDNILVEYDIENDDSAIVNYVQDFKVVKKKFDLRKAMDLMKQLDDLRETLNKRVDSIFEGII